MRFSAAMTVLAVYASVPAWAEDARPLIVGSGEATGYYYPVAGALCRVVNKEKPGSCLVMPSQGSAANITALRNGSVDVALVQSQAAMSAKAGSGSFKADGPFDDLRAIMSLHGETVLLLVRQDAGIESIGDLKGKRVNLGRPGSFQRSMAEAALEAAGLSEGDLAPAVELELSEQSPELCEGNIDAAFYAGIHPMAEAEMAVNECDALPISMKSKTVESFLKRNPWLSRGLVRKSAYPGLKDDVAALQVRALLATTAKLSPERVEELLKALHGNFPALTHLHPVLRSLTKSESAHDGIAVPLHDGADRFYAETGLK